MTHAAVPVNSAAAIGQELIAHSSSLTTTLGGASAAEPAAVHHHEAATWWAKARLGSDGTQVAALLGNPALGRMLHDACENTDATTARRWYPLQPHVWNALTDGVATVPSACRSIAVGLQAIFPRALTVTSLLQLLVMLPEVLDRHTSEADRVCGTIVPSEGCSESPLDTSGFMDRLLGELAKLRDKSPPALRDPTHVWISTITNLAGVDDCNRVRAEIIEACNAETDLGIAANILLNMFLARTTRYLRSMLLPEAEVAYIRQAAVPDTTVDLLGAMMAQYEEARRAHTPPAVVDAPDPFSRLAYYHATLDTWRDQATQGQSLPNQAHLAFLRALIDYLRAKTILNVAEVTEIRKALRLSVDPACPPFNYLLKL